ncbi:hypothetical protein HOD83_01625 [Candidatus Woesearchaeota archaeon]|jgi:hypothetical protein|nr:hypothetical protein [Candidatus Woesearchaeota archaeon]MBT4114408.1 hypothetical protein [Candidatus Woesearchaeota archaeon]MBT4248271.1 hypothetical protein [Candidatus Woesearchaeota archaeon]
MVKPPYYNKLVQLRKILEVEVEVDDFPEDTCDWVDGLLGLMFGFKRRLGTCFGKEHVWSFDPKYKVHIDLTMDQFLECNESVVVLPEHNDILRADPLAGKRRRDVYYDVLHNPEFRMVIGRSFDDELKLGIGAKARILGVTFLYEQYRKGLSREVIKANIF